MSLKRAATLAVLALMPLAGFGHALLHEVVDGEAVIVRLFFPGADQPLFEPYEVFAPDSEIPFQAGRVNALGEVSFRPDRPGPWRLRVFTADGHGAIVALEVAPDGAAEVVGVRQGPAHHHYWERVAVALGYLLGAFGVWALWRARRSRRPAV